MATKLDRIRAKVLEYDDYGNALEQFMALSAKDRELAMTDATMRGYLLRASSTLRATPLLAGAAMAVSTAYLKAQSTPDLPAQITNFLEQVALGNSEYDSISLTAAELLEKYTGRKVGTPNAKV